MSTYIDGFVIPVPKGNMEEYRRVAAIAAEVWIGLGALDYRECVGDDLETTECTSFRSLAGCSEEETVVFSWITYPSREARDSINAAVMQDPRMVEIMGSGTMPFDCKRMAYGGFTTLVSNSKANTP